VQPAQSVKGKDKATGPIKATSSRSSIPDTGRSHAVLPAASRAGTLVQSNKAKGKQLETKTKEEKGSKHFSLSSRKK
jgi:hypothetical protein